MPAPTRLRTRRSLGRKWLLELLHVLCALSTHRYASDGGDSVPVPVFGMLLVAARRRPADEGATVQRGGRHKRGRARGNPRSPPPNVLIYKLAFAGACITLLPAMLVTDDLLPAGVYQPPSHKYSEQAAKTTVPATNSTTSVTGAHTNAAQQQPKRLHGEPHPCSLLCPCQPLPPAVSCSTCTYVAGARGGGFRGRGSGRGSGKTKQQQLGKRQPQANMPSLPPCTSRTPHASRGTRLKATHRPPLIRSLVGCRSRARGRPSCSANYVTMAPEGNHRIRRVVCVRPHTVMLLQHCSAIAGPKCQDEGGLATAGYRTTTGQGSTHMPPWLPPLSRRGQ